MAAQPHLAPAADPVDEPIVVVLPDQSTVLVQPGTPEWLIAWAYREEKVARELVERDIRSKRALIKKMREDAEAEAERIRKSFDGRPVIEDAFDRWRIGSGHKRAKLTPERFDMAMSRMTEGYEPVDILMAAEGVARNPYVIEGTTHDDWKTAMQSGEQVERYANRCPPDVRHEIRQHAETQLALAV